MPYPRVPPSLHRRKLAPASQIPVAPSPRAPILERPPAPCFARFPWRRRPSPPVKLSIHALTRFGLRSSEFGVPSLEFGLLISDFGVGSLEFGENHQLAYGIDGSGLGYCSDAKRMLLMPWRRRMFTCPHLDCGGWRQK